MNKETIRELRERADEMVTAGIAGMLVGTVIVGCSVFGPGIGASVY